MQRELKPADYFAVLKKRRFTFSITFGLFFIISTIFLFMQTPVYRSTAVIKVDQGDMRAEGLVAAGQNSGGINSEIDEILSPEIMLPAMLEVKLLTPGMTQDNMQESATNITKAIKVVNPPQSRNVNISVDLSNPELAADLANAIASSFKRKYFERRTLQMRESRKFLEEQVDKAQRDLAVSEEKLMNYKKVHNEIDSSGGDTVPGVTNISVLENKLLSIGDKISDVEDQISDVERRKYGDPMSALHDFESLSVVRTTLSNLDDVKRRIEEMEEDYTDKYTELSDLKKRRAKLEAQLENIVKNQLDMQRAKLALQRTGLVRTRDELRTAIEKELKGAAERDMNLERLQREQHVNEEMFLTLQQQLNDVKLKEKSTQNEVRIISKALPAKIPVRPNKKIAILVSLTAGAFLGVLVCILLELSDTSFTTIEDIEEDLKLPVMGVIPAFHGVLALQGFNTKSLPEKQDIRLVLPVFFSPNSVEAESFCNLRARLLHNKRETDDKKVFLISSSSSQEGKSVLSLNTAAAIALMGARTVLISCDLRRPALRKWIHFEDRVGISQVLSGEADLDAVIKPAASLNEFRNGHDLPGVENLFLIPAGEIPPNPADLMDSERMNEVIATLRKQFDYIIFDTPPVLPIADSLLLAPKVDGVLLVYQHGYLPRRAVQRACKLFSDMGVSVQGVILNKVRSNQTDIYHIYSAYHYRYFKKGDPHKA